VPRASQPSSEERILLWVDQATQGNDRPVPLKRLVQQLKEDLTGIDYPTLERACNMLEQAGLIQRQWFTPSDFNLQITDRGRARAETLARQYGMARVPASPPSTGKASPAEPVPPSSPPPPSPAEIGTLNLPARLLLYGYLNGSTQGEYPTVSLEDVEGFLDGIGLHLAPGVLSRTLEEMESRGLARRRSRIDGGSDMEILPRGLNLADMLLDRPAPRARTPPRPDAAVPSSEEEEEDRPFHVPAAPSPREGTPGGPPGETERLRREAEELKRELQEEKERHRLDRETLEEVLRQLELLTRKVQEQERILKGSSPPG